MTIVQFDDFRIELSQPLKDRPDVIVVATSDGRRCVLGDGMDPFTAVSPKNTCERCGFVPKHMCQLDVIHICSDAHDPSNYMTLYSNCHRLKTVMNGDHLTPRGVSNDGDGHLQVDMFA